MGWLFGVFWVWFVVCVLGVGFFVEFGFVCFVVLLVVVWFGVIAVWLGVVCFDLLLLGLGGFVFCLGGWFVG